MPLRQWMLAITRYADRLLADLDGVDWDAGIKALQRAWIGRSEVGAAPLLPRRLARSILNTQGHRIMLHIYCCSRRDWTASPLQGANIRFQLEGGASSSLPPNAQLEVYTTRPDTVRCLDTQDMLEADGACAFVGHILACEVT
jgi:hypothetical protein